MRRESFNYLRTMRQVKTSLDLARDPARIQTTGARFRAGFEEELEPQINEKALALALEQERRKFTRQNQALARARQRLRDARARLFAMKVKNEHLMLLRHTLQKQRWLEPEDPALPPGPKRGGSDTRAGQRARHYRVVTVRRS